MTEGGLDTLDRFRRDADLSRSELWQRYFELGGMSTALQLDAILHGALLATRHDHNVIAHALNERFVELGGNHPVPYDEDTVTDGAVAGPAGPGDPTGPGDPSGPAGPGGPVGSDGSAGTLDPAGPGGPVA